MKSAILSEVFSGFCESRSHLDSILSKVDPARKHKTARLLGAFLRRPVSIARHYGIELQGESDGFFEQGFLRLKKHPGIHRTLDVLWRDSSGIPSEGTRDDFPRAMVEEWERDWGGSHAEELCRLLSQDPLTTIRFNRKAFTPEGELQPAIREWLDSGDLPRSRAGNFMGSARVFRGYAPVQQNRFFKEGFFEIQDEGSQVMSAFCLFPERIAPLLGALPVVGKAAVAPLSPLHRSGPLELLDACAGAGGKTLALADLMEGRGRIFAYDVDERKIRSLRMRAARAEQRNVKAVVVPSSEGADWDRFKETADTVLVDAPCSGIGVARRNPDVKWNRKPPTKERRDAVLPVTEIQSGVLRRYSAWVRPGGRLVYGVCTFGKAETLEQVSAFLSDEPSFRLESQGFIGPRDTDGFFMAAFRKT